MKKDYICRKMTPEEWEQYLEWEKEEESEYEDHQRIQDGT